MAKCLALAAALLLLLPARADDTAPTSQKVLAVTNDSGMASDGTIQDQDGYAVRIGELHAPGGEAYILPIRLFALPPGQHFQKVHLRAQLSAINNVSGLANADLYGLGLRESAKVLPTDYYQGPKPDPKATLLQAAFLTPASKVRTNADTGPFIDTDATGDAALTKYFNDAVAQEGSAGKYLILRVSYDADPIPSGNNAYVLLTTGADNDNEPPSLTYTLGPK